MTRRQSESAIQIAVAEFLKLSLPDSVKAFHVPNGGRRDARTGARLKREGVKAGAPDWVLLRQGGACGLIELKTESGNLSGVQREWRDWCGENGVPYAICRSVSDVQSVLVDWNIPLKGRVSA